MERMYLMVSCILSTFYYFTHHAHAAFDKHETVKCLQKWVAKPKQKNIILIFVFYVMNANNVLSLETIFTSAV